MIQTFIDSLMQENFIIIRKWLYPVSWIYGTGVWIRNKLFDWGVFHERKFDIPVISVGNLTVGGTGKTPHTEYLIKLLKKHYKVAVLNRGYKRKSKGFVLAEEDTPMPMIGDELCQMKQKFPEVYMAADRDRCHGIEQLCQGRTTSATEVIILDDAFQHRYVKPGLNLLMVDYFRMICDDKLLPAGRMREPQSGKNRADIVIVTKCPKDIMSTDFEQIERKLALRPDQKLYFTTLTYGKLHPLFIQRTKQALEEIEREFYILLVTGIAFPERLIKDLLPYSNHIGTMTFSDHHNFTAEDMKVMERLFLELPVGKRMIITTEKDAVRLSIHPALDAALKPFIFVLPIEVSFLQGKQESFNSTILDYVRQNSKNSRLS